MNSSLPNDNKDNPPQPTTGQSQMAAPSQTAPPPSNPPVASDSNPSKGETAPPVSYPHQPNGQYVVGVPPQQGMGPTWATGLFECFDDIPTLVVTFFAPCVTFGQVAEMVDRGQNSCGVYALLHAGIMYFTGCGCLLSAYYRIKMSQIYRLPDDPLINILVHLLCEPCALCQEKRELEARGFNMQLGVGWRNQSPETQQTGGVMVPPTLPGGMTR